MTIIMLPLPQRAVDCVHSGYGHPQLANGCFTGFYGATKQQATKQLQQQYYQPWLFVAVKMQCLLLKSTKICLSASSLNASFCLPVVIDACNCSELVVAERSFFQSIDYADQSHTYTHTQARPWRNVQSHRRTKRSSWNMFIKRPTKRVLIRFLISFLRLRHAQIDNECGEQ